MPRSESTSDEPFRVWVVGFEGSVQSSAQYAISTSGPSARALAQGKPAAEGDGDALANLLRRLRRREEEAWALAGRLAGVASGAKWVTVSPDRRYGLIGFEDSRMDVLRTAELVDLPSRARLKGFAFWGNEALEDAEWSQDSRLLGVLISRERWSRSPLDLALTVLGRPTPLKTFSVIRTDLRSLLAQRTLVATDVRFGTSMILRNIEP